MIRSLINSFVRTVRKSYLYIRRHCVFLLLDLLTFVLAYYIAVIFRRSLQIEINRADLFIKYGMIAALVYMVVELVTKSLFAALAGSAEPCWLRWESAGLSLQSFSICIKMPMIFPERFI